MISDETIKHIVDTVVYAYRNHAEHWDAQKIRDSVKAIIRTAEERARPLAGEEQVRVLRLVQYEGPRAVVETQVADSIHGIRVCRKGEVRITAVTLDQFPKVLDEATEDISEHYTKI